MDETAEAGQYRFQSVNLSTKEFALFETFMRRPGQVLSRFELLEHAWDYGHRTVRM